ncbi:MAG: DnaB-like helicase N-terminal domain-containing protein, partial [Solirubrobacterales bacterium]
MTIAAQPPDSASSRALGADSTPPHSIEAEQAVLGAILLSEQAHYTFVVEEELKARDFYRNRHRVVFAAMLELFDGGTEIDVLSVVEQLKSTGNLEDAGGADEIAELVTAVP